LFWRTKIAFYVEIFNIQICEGSADSSTRCNFFDKPFNMNYRERGGGVMIFRRKLPEGHARQWKKTFLLHTHNPGEG
jgi:hypothetical protein